MVGSRRRLSRRCDAMQTPYLKLYAQYINNFDVAVTALAECSRRLPAFMSFLESCQSSVQCNGTGLFTLLILPLERIASYSEDLEALRQVGVYAAALPV